MTGAYFKKWVYSRYPQPDPVERAAKSLGLTRGTLYAWFRMAELERFDVLALAQRGCIAPEDKAWLDPKRAAKIA